MLDEETHLDDGSAGSSLWHDAWRRLLKNKLAVFGMIVVIGLVVASLIGPSSSGRPAMRTTQFPPNRR